MIKKFKLIRNVGAFDSYAACGDVDLEKLSLIYAENGRGKTTLSAILRSLKTGSSILIEERKRLGQHNNPHIAIEGECAPDLVYQNGSWSQTVPNIRIFDDHFTHTNIYAGLEVDANQKQNLHELIIGTQGVELANRVENMVNTISQVTLAMRAKSGEITDEIRGPYSVDQFCALSIDPDSESKLGEAIKKLEVQKKSDSVTRASGFEPFEPRSIEFERIASTLIKTLHGIEEDALKAVHDHVRRLGGQGESWVAHGVARIQADQACPFCKQSLDGIDLINHYRAYFGDGYKSLVKQIDDLRLYVDEIMGENAYMLFIKTYNAQKEKKEFWSQFIQIEENEVDVDQVTKKWKEFRGEIVRVLEQKKSNPLADIDGEVELKTAKSEYEEVVAQVKGVSDAWQECNEEIGRLKEAASAGSLEASENDVLQLKAICKRGSDDLVEICSSYNDLKRRKGNLEAQKAEAREQLDEYRAEIFPKYQETINEYLRNFNAGFRLEGVEATNPRGVASTTYQLRINGVSVPLAQREPTEQAFKNTLSAGDRNALALAFFFASLDHEVGISDLIIVIDDPVSSLDDGRMLSTAQQIRELSEKANQVILLSHSKKVLCSVWGHAAKSDSAALSVVTAGNHSIVERWDVVAESVTEYDRNHALIRKYVAGQERDVRKVAQCIRRLLEGYLRVAFTEHFPPGGLIGPFVRKVRDLASSGNQVASVAMVDELNRINEYANKFHHDTDPNWGASLSSINETELRGYSEKALKFVNGGE